MNDVIHSWRHRTGAGLRYLLFRKGLLAIGAGYAGLAAAVELASNGVAVDLFEASQTLGGRARRVELEGVVMDNGQHILVGAYRESLRLIQYQKEFWHLRE